ncbi:MAG: adenosylmethionine decarboxylase [Deltaproteobacteria bacterium]|nr:adenosylmethionine decarboxylase [Deltaproteobacteria bacterium]
MRALGRHILVEYFNCDRELLNDPVRLESCLKEAAVKTGAHILSSTFRTFEPHGVSGVVIVAESHLAIHTWPEYGILLGDFFTCGEQANPWKAHEYLKNILKPTRSMEREILRGIMDRDISHKPTILKGVESV